MAVLTEKKRLADLLVYEAENFQSREQVVLAAGNSVEVGEVIGKVKTSAPATGTAATGNTGDGTCTGVSVGEDAQFGTYTLECVQAATNGGTFQVLAPNGSFLPDAEVGAEYANDQINFTINDGDTDFAVGDVFTIEVTTGSGKVAPINFTAGDGREDAYGVMADACDANTGDKKSIAITRKAQIVADYLTWPDGATDTQKSRALSQLRKQGIDVRYEA